MVFLLCYALFVAEYPIFFSRSLRYASISLSLRKFFGLVSYCTPTYVQQCRVSQARDSETVNKTAGVLENVVVIYCIEFISHHDTQIHHVCTISLLQHYLIVVS
jgi:hypothetical protein